MGGSVTVTIQHRRKFMAWLVVCLSAAFVLTPMLDAFTCRAEAFNTSSTPAAASIDGADIVTVAADATSDKAAMTSAPGGHSDDGGLSVCIHGHCHQSSIAAPAAMAEFNHIDAPSAAGPPALMPALHSADLAHAKPPPRA